MKILEHLLYRLSHLEYLREKSKYFEVHDIETKIKHQNNPHIWLQQDILQITHFQYRFCKNIILNEDIVPQIEAYS